MHQEPSSLAHAESKQNSTIFLGARSPRSLLPLSLFTPSLTMAWKSGRSGHFLSGVKWLNEADMAQKGLQEFYYTPDVGFKTSCHLSTLKSEKL